MKLKLSEIIPGVFPAPDKNRLFSTAVTAQSLMDIPADTVVGVIFQRYERDVITGKDVPVYFVSGLNTPVFGTCLKNFVI